MSVIDLQSLNPSERYLDNFDIAGFSFYDGIDVFKSLKIGTVLQLISEPHNKYDAHAVSIYYKDRKIGFVPRTHNRLLSIFLECGYDDLFTTRINRVCADEHPEHQIGVTIKIKNKTKRNVILIKDGDTFKEIGPTS